MRCQKEIVVLNTSIPRGKERRTYTVSIRRSCCTEHYDGIGLHDAVELAKTNSGVEYIYDDLAGEFVEPGVLERRLKRRVSVLTA